MPLVLNIPLVCCLASTPLICACDKHRIRVMKADWWRQLESCMSTHLARISTSTHHTKKRSTSLSVLQNSFSLLISFLISSSRNFSLLLFLARLLLHLLYAHPCRLFPAGHRRCSPWEPDRRWHCCRPTAPPAKRERV